MCGQHFLFSAPRTHSEPLQITRIAGNSVQISPENHPDHHRTGTSTALFGKQPI